MQSKIFFTGYSALKLYYICSQRAYASDFSVRFKVWSCSHETPCESGLEAHRQLRTQSFTVAFQLYRCQSEMPARCDLRAMMPMLAAKVYLYGAGLRFHSGLDAQRQLRTRSFRVALQLCRRQSESQLDAI